MHCREEHLLCCKNPLLIKLCWSSQTAQSHPHISHLGHGGYCPPTVPPNMANPSSHNYEEKLVQYVIAYLTTADEQAAQRASGLGATAREICIKRLKAHGTLAAMPSTGHPLKYTPEVCQLAIQILEEHDGEQLTLTRLLELLVDAGVVQPPTDRDNFSRHLRAYVHTQGRYIDTTSIHTIFLLARTDCMPRVDFSTAAQELLKDRQLEDIVFVDETTWEEAPHPKGTRRTTRRAAFKGRGQASSYCCAPATRPHVPEVPSLHMAWHRPLRILTSAARCPPTTPLACFRAAHPGVVPHIQVSGITHPPQRPYTSSPSVRQAIKLVVAAQLGHKPVVCHLTGTKYEGCPELPKYYHPDGTPYSKMGATEYCNHLNTVFNGPSGSGHMQLRRRPSILWHDHDTTHLANSTRAWLQQHGIQELVMPVRSPDLDPLDYGVFGAAKSALRRCLSQTRMGWDEACRTFVAGLRAMDTDAIIRELPLRLQACIESNGGHIEERLRVLKRQKSQCEGGTDVACG